MAKVLFSTSWLSLCEGEITSYVASADGVMCMPITPEGQVLFILEPTAYDGEFSLYLPSGKVEDSEVLADCANRELQEEAGVKAGRMEHLATIRPWFKYLASVLTLFLARDLVPSKLKGDEEYPIEIEYIPLATFEEHISTGRLRDASVIAALFLAPARLERES